MSDRPIGHVALTFDDGPNERTTAVLLGILADLDARATMFTIGANVERHPRLARALADAGMWVENHSWSHPHLLTLDTEQVEREIVRTQAVVGEVTGATPALFRPPFLETDVDVRGIAARHGLVEILTDVDTRDWAEGTTADEIVTAATGLGPGEVLLMHDWPPATLEALPRVVAELRARGLEPGRIDPGTGRAVAP